MKQFVLVGLLCLGTQLGFSQSLLQRFSLGLKAGANYSDFNDASFDTEGLVGFHGGLIVNFGLTDKWSLQQEFLYSTQGAKAKGGLFGERDIKLAYLSIPLLVKYHSNIGLYGEFGGQANVLIEDAKDTGPEDFADKIDGGVIVGLGYQFRNGPVKGLGIGARYYFGLTEVGKFNSGVVNSDFKNQVAQLSAFYTF